MFKATSIVKEPKVFHLDSHALKSPNFFKLTHFSLILFTNPFLVHRRQNCVFCGLCWLEFSSWLRMDVNEHARAAYAGKTKEVEGKWAATVTVRAVIVRCASPLFSELGAHEFGLSQVLQLFSSFTHANCNSPAPLTIGAGRPHSHLQRHYR